VDIYDAATGQWSTATLSEHLSRPQAATVGTQVLVAANRTSLLPGGRVSDRVDIYDAATGQWSTATLSVARAAPFPATVGSLVLFAGGTLGRTPPNDAVTSDRIDLYDSATGAWSTATLSRSGGQSLPRWGFAVAQVGTQVLFAGGFTGARMGLAQSRVVDIYDAASGQWTTGELSVVLPEGERLSVAEVGTRALFAGGSGVDIYDSTTGRWSTARLSQRRVRMAVATVGNRVLLAGGAAIDIYDSPPRP
jgi:hypothetical protein